MTAANTAAKASAELGRDALNWYKEQYADTADERARASDIANRIGESQIDLTKTQTDLANEYADYNRTTFRPLEKGLVEDAQNYDTPEKRAAAAREAQTDVGLGLSQARDASARRMAASGINPGSTRALSATAGQDIESAKLMSGASYNARKGVETMGHAMKMDAASLGRGLPSSQAAAAQAALGAGNSAVATAQTPVNIAYGGANLGGAGYDAAIRGVGNAGNIFTGAGNAGRSDDSAAWGAVGSVAGAALAFF